jgi:hypothetical protein
VAGVAFSGARFSFQKRLNDARRISAQCGILCENLVAGKREQRNILRLRRGVGCLDAENTRPMKCLRILLPLRAVARRVSMRTQKNPPS